MKNILFLVAFCFTNLLAVAQCVECRSFEEASKDPKKVKSIMINGWVDKILLDSIPSNIDIFENLEILYLSDQPIKTIPPAIGRLTKLKELSFANCRLETLPGFIYGMKHLKELILNDNPFSTTEITSIKKRAKAEMPRTQLIL